jgi:hypothetical protein
MSGAGASGVTRGDGESDVVTAPVIAKWLHLAAAPTFAIMALLTAVHDHGQPNLLCSVGDSFWSGGMAPMYVLMSVFHAAPWLKLISRR